MFKDNKKIMAENTSGTSNRIVAETKFKGEISSKSDFRIDGEIEGDVQTAGKLVIGKNGFVKGNITCENADVEGKIEGVLKVNNVLSLKSTAVIEGEVHVKKLSIEPGAVFNVSCTMNDSKPIASKNHDEKANTDKAAKQVG